MSQPDQPDVDDRGDVTSDQGVEDDSASLAAQLDLLAEENRRLRREYRRVRRANYRRTALGLAGVGAVAVIAGVLFPGSREVLVALGAVGLFGAILTYYLTPERFIAASVGERVYAALADNEADIAADLGLTDARVYIPTDDTASAADAGTRLFVPQREDYLVPEADALAQPFVVDADGQSRGIAFRPTADPLFAEFEQALAGPLAADPEPLAEQLADAVVEQFELADGARVDAGSDPISVGISGSVYGPVDRFDHPVASLLGVGMARGLDRPVRVEVTDGGERFDAVVTLRGTASGSSLHS